MLNTDWMCNTIISQRYCWCTMTFTSFVKKILDKWEVSIESRKMLISSHRKSCSWYISIWLLNFKEKHEFMFKNLNFNLILTLKKQISVKFANCKIQEQTIRYFLDSDGNVYTGNLYIHSYILMEIIPFREFVLPLLVDISAADTLCPINSCRIFVNSCLKPNSWKSNAPLWSSYLISPNYFRR